ncbi:MAG: hypothetical protein WAL90_16770 [Desulfobacterales bacterium]
MTQNTTTSGQTEEPAVVKTKKESTRVKEAVREVEDKYQDVKKKAAETKDRVTEKMAETASAAKRESRAIAKEAARKGKDAGGAVYEALSENLFPAILTGLGVAWLTAGIVRSRSDSRPQPGIYRESVSTAQEKLSEWGDKAKEVTQRAKASSRRTRRKTKDVITNNPLYLAGSLMAIGALIGFAFPETRREKELYGEVREEFQEGRKSVETESS